MPGEPATDSSAPGPCPLLEGLPEHLGTGAFALTRWRRDDEPVLGGLVAASIGHLVPWMPWAASEPAPAPERRALLERWEQEWIGRLGAAYKVHDGDGEPCGVASLFRTRAPQLLEIGYWLAPHATGHGTMTRAAGILTTEALSHVEVDTVVIHHDAANWRSGGVPGRLGFARRSARTRDIEAPGECGITVRWEADRRWVKPAWLG